MNKLWTSVAIIVIILVFVGYMVFDLAFKKDVQSTTSALPDITNTDKWEPVKVFDPGIGKLKAVAVSKDAVILAGESFIAAYSSELSEKWNIKTESPVTSVAIASERIYAVVNNTIRVFGINGEIITDWGTYDEKSLITSISANDNYIAFADATSKIVFILDKGGEVKYFAGKDGEPFNVPSPYFDVVLGRDNTLYVVNPGNRRIERRTIDGKLIDYFGQAGLEADAFCGCCNPAHFTLYKDGYVTSEKGINRIKILDNKGNFIEFVSSVNKFLPPMPLDIAVSDDGQTIYGANPADSKLYLFKRKQD